MDIFLVRHGEAAAAWSEASDPGLSDLGRQQAIAVCDVLSAQSDLQIISSPLQRARDTATPLAAALGAEIEIDATFQEIPSPEGLTDRQAWLRALMHREWSLQSEQLIAWRQQAWLRLFELPAPTVIFTHFMLINAMVGRSTGASKTVVFTPDNGSITRFSLEDGEIQLLEQGREMNTRVD